jgi:hypothetical protein
MLLVAWKFVLRNGYAVVRPVCDRTHFTTSSAPLGATRNIEQQYANIKIL